MLGPDVHFSRGPLASWNGFWGRGLAGQPCAPESALHERRYARRLQNGIFEWEVKALPAGKLFPRPLFPRTACPAERVPEVATSPAGRQGRNPGSRNSGSGSASSARSKVATHAKARNAILGLHCASKRRVPPAKMGKLYRAEMSLGPTSSWRAVHAFFRSSAGSPPWLGASPQAPFFEPCRWRDVEKSVERRMVYM